MYRIFKFLYSYRAFILFIALELLAMILIYRFNSFQGSSFFHTSNRLTGNFYQSKADIQDYFELKEMNKDLLQENARLREELKAKELRLYLSERNKPEGFLPNIDIIEAKVINNTINHFANNYITLNKGKEDGVQEGMSVLGSNGIVGIVKSVSDHFSVVYSILNSKLMVSCRLNNSGDIATLRWDGQNYQISKLDFLPRHVTVHKGDTVSTSGFNAVFPEGSFVGVVESVTSSQGDMFLDIDVRLGTDFSQLNQAYIIRDFNKPELDSLQNKSMRND